MTIDGGIPPSLLAYSSCTKDLQTCIDFYFIGTSLPNIVPSFHWHNCSGIKTVSFNSSILNLPLEYCLHVSASFPVPRPADTLLGREADVGRNSRPQSNRHRQLVPLQHTIGSIRIST
jgi:hypothetical protein